MKDSEQLLSLPGFPPMRIAFVAPFGLRAKGTTRARVLPLARELARRGHTVAVFVAPYDSPEDSGRCWIDESVDVINIALPGLGQGGAAWHLWLGWRLFRVVRAWRPDVAHVFKPKGPSGLAGAMLWATRGRETVGTQQEAPGGLRVPVSRCLRVIIDTDDWEGSGGWNDDPRAGYSTLQRRFFAWQERYGLSHANAWTVTSECLRQRAVTSGADPSRVFTLHNGAMVSGKQGQESGVRDQGSGVTRRLYFTRVSPGRVRLMWLQFGHAYVSACPTRR